jgi:hypothetical protein
MTKITLIDYHQFQGASNDCAPHTVAMVVNAYKKQKLLEGDKVAKRMNRPTLRVRLMPLVIRRVPNWATFPWGIVDELRENGIRARWRFGAGVADLQKALDEDRVPMPIIGELKMPGLWAHVKALAVIDPAHGYGFVDPAHPKAEISWQSKVEFERLWDNLRHLLVETL